MVTERLISMAALVIIGNKLSQLTVESCLMQREPKLILIAVKLKKALSLITQLKALNGNYDVTSKDFDEGKVAFLPMSLATYRTYKPYPYHIAKYSTFFGLVSPYQLAKKEWIRPKYQLRFMLFLLKLDTARQLGIFKTPLHR